MKGKIDLPWERHHSATPDEQVFPFLTLPTSPESVGRNHPPLREQRAVRVCEELQFTDQAVSAPLSPCPTGTST